jgi:hypothetical protein
LSNEGIEWGTHSAMLYESPLLPGVILSFIQKSSTLGVHWKCGLVEALTEGKEAESLLVEA